MLLRGVMCVANSQPAHTSTTTCTEAQLHQKKQSTNPKRSREDVRHRSEHCRKRQGTSSGLPPPHPPKGQGLLISH